MPPVRLSPEQLRVEQQRTLARPPRRYGLLALALFRVMDLVYGRARRWSKFKVLEIIARVPYQAWEHVAYIAITHTHDRQQYARRIFDRVRESREQQDNEQWHLLILEEWVNRHDIREGTLRYRVLPLVLAFIYYHVTWILYVIRPGWSYRLNADLEDHAEREYMKFAQEHPELEREPFLSLFAKDFGNFPTMADVVRQIAIDERAHREDSESRIHMTRLG
jgi:hypothetical protein